MNALVSLDSILEPTVPLSASTLFGSGQVETIVAAIETQVRAEIFDMTTEEGRERIKSVAYKIARSKTTLDEIGKEHVAEIKKQSGDIDKERKALRDRLDALKEEIRKPLTDWEAAEHERVADHEAGLVVILEQPHAMATSTEIRAQLSSIAALFTSRDWQEFQERADAAVNESSARLSEMLATAEQRERDAAELAELRALKAEREEADRKAAEAARQAAAEEERKANEAIRAKRAEEEKAEAVRKAVAEAEAKAEREKQAAIEAERRRQEQEARDAQAKKAAEDAAERKRQENKRHREKVHSNAAAALQQCGFPEDVSGKLIEAIAAGIIPHVHIQY